MRLTGDEAADQDAERHLTMNSTRRSDYDVTNSVKTTDPATVASEVRRIYLDLYRKADAGAMDRA